ncbi:MAG TPA: hypothetical protein P5045_04605 [Methanothrix sp.]|nr:hypothetical protein [Methanothrix sp.]
MPGAGSQFSSNPILCPQSHPFFRPTMSCPGLRGPARPRLTRTIGSSDAAAALAGAEVLHHERARERL